ncbi:MAG TPA: hypothetical protein PL045_09165 [Chitinophagaceae bacterium]|nr:hypothetical protein [Chitinophagaceae bacterium]
MNNIKIKKAKIKDELFLEAVYVEELPGHSKKDITMSCTVPVHDDLKNAFRNLDKHLALLCDDLPCKAKKIELWDDEKIHKYTVKGFSISGNDENEGVTLSGNKEAQYGIVNLNTPFQKWEGSEYSFMDELNASVEDCLYEVEQYLFHGKRAPEKQLEMEFPEEAEINATTAAE